MEGSSVRQLFGGAITAMMPGCLVDASDLRQVPDTQEVFMYPDNGISIIVEILERVEASLLEDAARFHFDSLAHDNSAHESKVLSVETLSASHTGPTPAPTLLVGEQKVPKFNHVEADDVKIYMALYRIEGKDIDLVVTFNMPMRSQDNDGVGDAGLEKAKKDFEELARSLRIVDFGLFA